MRGRSGEWHEVSIAPVFFAPKTTTADKVSQERLLLQRRFLHLLLRDAAIASKSGFIVVGRLVFVGVTMLVFGQKHKLPFLALKSAGYFIYFIFCIISSRGNENDDDSGFDEIPEDLCNICAEEVYTLQTSAQPNLLRNLQATLSI